MSEVRIAYGDPIKVRVSDLQELQGSLKELNKNEFEKLKKEIEQTGFAFSPHVWISPDGGGIFIVDGTQRIRVLRSIAPRQEISVIPVEATSLKEAKRRIMQGASQYGKMTSDGLYEFQMEAGIDFGDIESSFRFPEINFDYYKAEFFEDSKAGLIGDDDVPEAKDTRCKTGDLWQLGEHRLLCGDCTVKENVERLMGGEKADMVFTDPPYGLGDKKSFNNDHADYEDEKPFDLTTIHFGERFVIWGANYYDWLPLPRNEIGWTCWDKRPSRESWDIETRAAADRIFGQHFEIACTSVSEIRGKMLRITWGGFYGTAGKPEEAIVHKTQKPTELAIKCFQPTDKLILDYFLGSGSTLIACEKTGRRCFGMEIDEHYCDVILSRWEQFSGKTAVKGELGLR